MSENFERRQYRLPSKVISTNIELLTSREALGLQKYGHTLDRTDLTHRELLQHGLEEALDLANYLQASLQKEQVYEKAYHDLRQRLEKLLAKEAQEGVRNSVEVTKLLMATIAEHKTKYLTL